MQRCEHALGRARHPDHAAAFHVQQGQVGSQRQALRRQRVVAIAFGIDAGAWMRGIEGVADQDRGAARDRRRHGLRMDHLGAEISQLAGLVIAHARQQHGVGHGARIG
jgi:hypothetical protein